MTSTAPLNSLKNLSKPRGKVSSGIQLTPPRHPPPTTYDSHGTFPAVPAPGAPSDEWQAVLGKPWGATIYDGHGSPFPLPAHGSISGSTTYDNVPVRFFWTGSHLRLSTESQRSCTTPIRYQRQPHLKDLAGILLRLDPLSW